jgi:hypothetical protein
MEQEPTSGTASGAGYVQTNAAPNEVARSIASAAWPQAAVAMVRRTSSHRVPSL